MKQCVLIQGPLYDKCIPILIDNYKNYTDKFISTWIDEDQYKIKQLEENGFTVILNKHPAIRHAIWHQKITIQGGLDYIKKLNMYTHVFRIRTDVSVNDINKVMKTFETFDPDKPIFLTFFKHLENAHKVYLKDGTFRDPTQHGYLMVHFIYGTLDFMNTYFDTNWQPDDGRWDEIYHQELYFKAGRPLKYNEMKDKIQICINRLKEEGIMFYYTKPGRESHPELLHAYTNCPARYVGYTEEDFLE